LKLSYHTYLCKNPQNTLEKQLAIQNVISVKNRTWKIKTNKHLAWFWGLLIYFCKSKLSIILFKRSSLQITQQKFIGQNRNIIIITFTISTHINFQNLKAADVILFNEYPTFTTTFFYYISYIFLCIIPNVHFTYIGFIIVPSTPYL